MAHGSCTTELSNFFSVKPADRRRVWHPIYLSRVRDATMDSNNKVRYMKKILGSIKTYRRNPRTWWYGENVEKENAGEQSDQNKVFKALQQRDNFLEEVQLNGKAKHREKLRNTYRIEIPDETRSTSAESLSVQIRERENAIREHVDDRGSILASRPLKISTGSAENQEQIVQKIEKYGDIGNGHYIKPEASADIEKKRKQSFDRWSKVLIVSEGHYRRQSSESIQIGSEHTIPSQKTDHTDYFITAQSQVSAASSPIIGEIPSSCPSYSPLTLDEEEVYRYATPEINIPSSLQEAESGVNSTIANTQWWEDEFSVSDESVNSETKDEQIIPDTDSEIELVSDSVTETPDSSPTKLTQSYFRKLLSDSLIESLPLPPQRKLEYVRLFRDEDSETQDE
jgi:hypothetical protein